MKNTNKLLIGAALIGGGLLAWKFLKPKAAPAPAPAPAPGGSIAAATTQAINNVQSLPTNIALPKPKPGALIGSTGVKNIMDTIKQNVAANTGTLTPINISPVAASIIKPATSTTAASLIKKPTTSANIGGLFNQQKPTTNKATSALMAAIANARKN